MKRGKDYIGVGCGALIVNEKNEVLLMRRGPLSSSEVGKWSIPGGAVEFNEPFHSALKREVKEEIDVDITIVSLLAVTDSILPHESQHWVGSQFLARITAGTPKIMEPTKCDGLEWFSLDALPENLTQAVKDATGSLLQKRSEHL